MQRSYCFVFLMTDRMFLVASWPFLVTYVHALLAKQPRISSAAHPALYPGPISPAPLPPFTPAPASPGRPFRPALRSFRAIATEVQQRVDHTFERETARMRAESAARGVTFISSGGGGGGSGIAGADHLARRRGNQPLRSLVELAGSKVCARYTRVHPSSY